MLPFYLRSLFIWQGKLACGLFVSDERVFSKGWIKASFGFKITYLSRNKQKNFFSNEIRLRFHYGMFVRNTLFKKLNID